MNMLKDKIDSLPFQMGIQHYYPLQDTNVQQQKVPLTQAAGWDLVRVTKGHFFIPEDRDQWLDMCHRPGAHDSNPGDLPDRAASLLRFIDERNLGGQLFSLGVGLAALEFHIKALRPGLQVFCSDYGCETVRRLEKTFTECDGIRHFDLIRQRFKDVFPEATPSALVLVHRMDPHLNDDEWKQAFSNFAADGVRHVLFVPHRVLTLKYLATSKSREFLHRIKRTPLALSGGVRTYKRWLRLWGDDYKLTEIVPVGYSKGFRLELRTEASK